MIWIPSVTFLNTADQVRSLRDNKSLVTVDRFGQYHNSDSSKTKNIYIYSGEENPMEITRVYSTKWLCNYNMLWYPFDTQVQQRKKADSLLQFIQYCLLHLSPSGNSQTYIQLSLGRQEYSGATELTQYFVRGSVMNMAVDNVTVEVEVE